MNNTPHQRKFDLHKLRLAEHLLAGDARYKGEGNVVSDLVLLLSEIGIDHLDIEREYAIGRDRIDIYLPRYRTIIEAKARNRAADPNERRSGESPKEQLERYVLAEIASERGRLPLAGELPSNEEWTGVITDGQHWHIYVYPHIENSHEKQKTLHSGQVQNGPELVQLLSGRLGGEPIGRTWIPAEPAHLFRPSVDALDRLYREMPQETRRDTETKHALWHDMLRVSGMSPPGRAAPDRLFVTHSLLIAIARMVTHSLKHQTNWKPALKEGFAAWFLGWPQGETWASQLWEIVTQYDWRRRHGDVLRSLYETFVPQADRKVFGEFYTPDWLAAMVVEDALDDEWMEAAIQRAEDAIQNRTPFQGTGVLDPACGSGTFLYHAALRMLEAPAMQDLQPTQKADVAALLLNGIDVHPVAVEIAKANLMRVLPAEPTEGESAIRVYLGDSLQVGEEQRSPLFDKGEMRLVTPKGGEILIPLEFVRQDRFDDNMRRLVNAAAAGKPVPLAVLNTVPESRRKDLQQCRDHLAERIGKEGNSVWTWYATNIAAPYLLSERKVDRIVANPPWVKLSEIQEIKRKRAMESFGNKTMGLQEGGRQAPHLDIAAFFILRARELYMNGPQRDPAVWLVKKSALHAGHWKRFREKHRTTLAQSVDLEPLQPFGGGDARRCCLLMEHRPLRSKTPDAARLEAQLRPSSGTQGRPKKPKPEESWSAVRPRIQIVAVPDPLPQEPSEYSTKKFRQGAPIVPHVLLVVESSYPQRDRIRVRTKKSSQPTWKNIPPQDIEIPKRWLAKLYKSTDMLPFLASLDEIQAIIPVDEQGRLDLDSAQEEFGWNHLNDIYRQHRGKGKNTPRTLEKQIDFHGKLSAQPQHRISDRHIVLYPVSGDIMRAAKIYSGSGFVDATLYWYATDCADEAGYLTTLLNAPCLRRAFSESRESGRDFHLHPWRKVPIPRYDGKNGRHFELARLCGIAEKVALELAWSIRQKTSSAGQQKISKAIRKRLASDGISQAIDEVVVQLLPDQAMMSS
ncbi:MAG: N-6 DNA methylase [bacterium]|nr:N-6 DNA methylase [bacterium]